MRQSFLAAVLLTALLAGCSSGVKLSDVPVEDKSGSTSSASASGVNQAQGSGVANVVTEKAGSGIGPAGVSHVVYFDCHSGLLVYCKKKISCKSQSTSGFRKSFKLIIF